MVDDSDIMLRLYRFENVRPGSRRRHPDEIVGVKKPFFDHVAKRPQIEDSMVPCAQYQRANNRVGWQSQRNRYPHSLVSASQ